MWRRHHLIQSAVQQLLPCRRGLRSAAALPSAAAIFARRSIGGGQKVFYSTCVTKTSAAIFGSGHLQYWIQSSSEAHDYSPLQSAASFSTQRKGRKSPPRFSDDSTVDELVQIAHDNLDVMTPLATAALWNKIYRQLDRRDGRNNNNRGARKANGGQNARNIDDIFQHTIDTLREFSTRELTQTILSLSKIAAALRKQRNKRGESGHKRVLRELLLNKNMKPNEDVFQSFANASMGILEQFGARHLSNLALAYAKIDYVPKFDDGSDLFDHIATEAVDTKGNFSEQGISNLMWSYATVNKPHPVLFETIGDQVVAIKHLGEFKPQGLSNTVWAYATAGINHPKLFEKVANHIVGLDTLDPFKPQALSNTVLAYPKAGFNHPKLFQKVANHIVKSDILNRFIPQHLSNTVWAFAAADINHPKLFDKVANHIVQSDNLHQFRHPQDFSNTVWAYATAGVNHPKLFENMANHIVESDVLNRFNEQALSNTMWAYATAGVNHPELFHKVTKAAIQRTEFDAQGVANLLWSYATMSIIDKELFSSFESTAAKLVDSYNNQDLSHIAWAYAVADHDAPTLFNKRFINKCVEKKDGFVVENFSQLYQWHLWQTQEKSNAGLPQELLDKCHEAFISQDVQPSRLQDNVVAHLSSIGLEPQEEVLMDSGYRIDAVVEVNGKQVGVEVDGPWHFIGKGRSPLGRTIIKRRQVPAIDGIELVSVPYWEWDKLGKDEAKKQDCLWELLGFESN